MQGCNLQNIHVAIVVQATRDSRRSVTSDPLGIRQFDRRGLLPASRQPLGIAGAGVPLRQSCNLRLRTLISCRVRTSTAAFLVLTARLDERTRHA
ncbi:MAG: hypothetical protein GY745_06455 [Actinomycetia bacterium]|nr:hypothetical protein [Actinomycetes bacterium]MCP4084676.1 hypothetical protein [Actinomycetes bacterium]